MADMLIRQINDLFTGFYGERGYHLLAPSSLLDSSIPMSYVMSAGLVQVEKSLAQIQDRDSDRYVLVQHCFRYFDIDKVGSDDIHLSFFFMPGAFTFGTPSTSETVGRMWQLATSQLGISSDRLWASYFAGGQVFDDELGEDILVRKAWLKVGLPEERIVPLGRLHNFWIQGKGFQNGSALRKCGPNTELFYDRGREYACSSTCLPGCGCGRFIEFSNSLFVRYCLDAEGRHIHLLSEPFTETVIGAERVAMVMEGAASVFCTHEYQKVINAIAQFVTSPLDRRADQAAHIRVIADHLRALYYLVMDGAPPPGKDGRRRIIKILIRRVISRQILLGIDSIDFLDNVLRAIIGQEEPDAYQQTLVTLSDYLASERSRFFHTLNRGCFHIARIMRQNGGETLTEEQEGQLESKCGIPRILTADIVRNISLGRSPQEIAGGFLHERNN